MVTSARFILLGVLGALSACAADRADPLMLIALYSDYQSEIPATIQQAIHGEVDSIISPAGLTLDWRSLADRKQGDVSVVLLIVRFKGSCDVTELSSYPEYPFTLGNTVISDGEILPYANVYCNAVRAFLTAQLLPLPPKDRAAAYGRAVGRVVAHELYHILAHTKHHGSGGLAERACKQQELMAAEFRFNQGDMQKLRLRLLPAVLQVNGLSGTVVVNPQKVTFFQSGCIGCHGIDGEGAKWGPSLQSARKSYDYARLRFRLEDTHTKIYRRARELGVMWPELTEAEVFDLAGFLKNGGR